MPPATLTWLDYSEADQRRAREIVAMFSQREKSRRTGARPDPGRAQRHSIPGNVRAAHTCPVLPVHTLAVP